jgi:predicted glycoside hydrolase/deacetylase ChbG (UPF0249 family)
MLIINADDLGRDAEATKTCLACFSEGRITSASLMVFMKDSACAAGAARSTKLETGLHLNLTQPYDGTRVAERVRESQILIARYFRLGKWAQVIYNPFLKRAVAAVFQSQLDEYRRLFQGEPAHLNGHRHMHLSMNMIVGGVIPNTYAVRRSFTFCPGEKGILNRFYRRVVDTWLRNRYRSTDAFFSIEPVSDMSRLNRIVDLARLSDVELMVHAWRSDQFDLLMSDKFRKLIASVHRGAFSSLGSSVKTPE